MSYIKNAYLDLSEELGLAPAQLLSELNEKGVEAEEELSYEDAKHQRSAERAGEEALNYLGR